MFGSGILEVAIGLIFIFLVVSIMCAAVREGIEAWLKTRSAYLEHGIRELLNDKSGTGLAASFYHHPLIFSLFSGPYTPGKPDQLWGLVRGGKLPSYIPARNFALTLLDIAARGPETDAVSADPNSPAISVASVRRNILNLNNPAVQRVLLTALDSAQNDLERALANVAAWYDGAMDRVSGKYKRSTQFVLFGIGVVLAVALNINTITLVDFLYRNDTVRDALVARAETVATDTSFLRRNYDQTRTELNTLSLPIGWTAGWGAPRRGNEPGAQGWWNDGFAPVLGWLLTALAAALGAPFWFDLLNKVMVIRSTVKPHEKSPEEGSEDRQPAKRKATDELPETRVLTGVAAGGAVSATVGAADLVAAGRGALPALDVTPSPRDADSNLDGCDVVIEDVTSDEELPAAEGGVA